jgi:type IV pilus assembly protein PilC
MQTFSYRAINERGTTISGTMEAESMDNATTMLVDNGLIPTKVQVLSATRPTALLAFLTKWIQPVRMLELILFTKQFRTMIRAGIPVMQLLQSLETQTEDPALKKIIIGMSHDISQGSTLHDALAKHPRVFSPLYCSMIRAGEASGALPEVMDRLIYIMEHEHKIRTDIRTALQYPIFVMTFLGAAFFVLLTYVIPKFVTIFERSGLTLPLLTRICIQAYRFLTTYGPVLAVAAVVGGVALGYYLKTDEGRLFKDKWLLKLPLLGTLFTKAAMARFASIFSILQSSGVAVLDSMRILQETINNRAIAQEFDRLAERLEEGRGIAGPLRQSQYFTPIVINMTAIGEESGKLEEMLVDIAAHYDWELEYAVKRFNDALGPILIIGMAAVIGFFALAIYMPMWDLSRVVK